jgi:hypothetical protein
MAQAQVASQLTDKRLAVLGPDLTALFKLDDLPPHMPISLGDVRVDRLHRLHTALDVDVGYLSEQIKVGSIRFSQQGRLTGLTGSYWHPAHVFIA